jgi:hypothetical protein
VALHPLADRVRAAVLSVTAAAGFSVRSVSIIVAEISDRVVG